MTVQVVRHLPRKQCDSLESKCNRTDDFPVVRTAKVARPQISTMRRRFPTIATVGAKLAQISLNKFLAMVLWVKRLLTNLNAKSRHFRGGLLVGSGFARAHGGIFAKIETFPPLKTILESLHLKRCSGDSYAGSVNILQNPSRGFRRVLAVKGSGEKINAQLLTALCSDPSISAKQRAICAEGAEIALVDGKAPEWIPLMPAGEVVTGRDGERWFKRDAAAIIEASKAYILPAAIDWGHALELKFEDSAGAPAAGWIEDYEVREAGAIWGRVNWTPDGVADIENKRYRYISPVFDFNGKTREIVRIIRAGLTNKPRLFLTAIASLPTESALTTDKEMAMNEFLKRIAAALGLAAESTEDVVFARIGELQRASAAEPSLERFVPRKEHDLVLQRAEAAEGQLADLKKQEHTRKVTSLLDAAVKAGKITPANRGFFERTAASEDGFKQLEEFVGAAPVIASDGIVPGTPPAPAGSELSETQRAVCSMLGISEEAYKKQLQTAN